MRGGFVKICTMLSTVVFALAAGTLSAQMPLQQMPGQSTSGLQLPGQQQQGRGSSTLPGQRQGQGQRTGGGLPGQRQQTDAPDENTPFFGEGTEQAASDTIKKRRPKKPLESYFFPDSVRARENTVWSHDTYMNHIRIESIDTLQADFQNGYPFMKKGVGSAYLGNLGAPSQYLSYFDRHRGNHPSFADPWQIYLRTPETTPFYNVKQAFSRLDYTWAGQRMRQEEDFGVIHAQNISPQTGFNVDYRSLGTRGIYAWQATRDKRLSLGVNHTGKRYSIMAAYIYNSVYNRENGGLVSDDDVIVDIDKWQMAMNIPMRMSDPKNWIKNNSWFMTQSYGIPMRRVREEDFTIADRPAVFIGHTVEYDRWVRKYEDTHAGTTYQSADRNTTLYYYDRWDFNPTSSRDSLFESRLANRIYVQIQPWDRGGVVGTIDGGVGVDLREYYQFSPGHFLAGVKNTAVRETEYYAYAGAGGRVKQYFDWSARFKLHPFGDAAGDIEASGQASARLFVKGRPLSVSGNFSFSSLRPSYWEQNFSSNHYTWSNSFSKENETRFDASLGIPHIGFSATVSQSILGGRIYYNAEGLPAQAPDVVSVTGVYLREDLPIRIGSSSINLNHRAMLQWSTNQAVVPVPLASVYLSWFYEFNVVKNVLRLQVGVDGRYNTPYWAPGYNPGTGQFYNQREKHLGNYVWMDLFVNAKWKRMRILIKVQHLNDDMFGKRNYFSVLHYPMNRRVLKIGFSWNFYD